VSAVFRIGPNHRSV